MFTKLLGILGGLFFAYCGVPTAYATIKTGKSIGTPVSVAWMIVLGSILMYVYLYRSYGFDAILTFNYLVEAGSWGVVVFYHYKGADRGRHKAKKRKR